MKRVFLCLSHQTHLLKEHLIKLKLIYITFWFDGKFYSRTCSGVDLLSGVHTTGCQPLHLLSSSNGGQTIELSRRAMYFRGIRGGSTGSLLCNAIPRLRRRKRKTKRFRSVPNKRWRVRSRVKTFAKLFDRRAKCSVLPASVSLPIKCLRALRG